jgi:hypothetical protein
MEAVPGLYSAAKAKGSALYTISPVLLLMPILYSFPDSMPGTKAAQIPELPTGKNRISPQAQ